MTNKDFKEDISEYQYSVNLKYIPEPRTIDDLEEGDIIVDKDGYKKKCLAKCGEVYALSYTGEGDTVNEYKRSSGGYTLYELKEHGFTLYQLYQEPTPTDDTIEIEGVKYKASEVKEALKNFKNKN